MIFIEKWVSPPQAAYHKVLDGGRDRLRDMAREERDELRAERRHTGADATDRGAL